MPLTKEETSKFVVAGKHRLHYHEAGQGPALLMIHGGGPGAGAWSNYRRNIDALSQKFRVIMPDLPCFADSDKPRIDTSLFKFMADAMRNFLDALDIDKAHIVGNSLGGATAIRLVLDTPERANHLVLMGTAGGLQLFSPAPSEGAKHLFTYYDEIGPTPEKLDRFLDCMVYDRSLLTDDLIQERLSASLQPGLKESWPFSPKTMPPIEPLWKEFDRVSNKTLIVWGRDDRTVPMDNAWLMLNQMPDVRLHIFSRTGHWVQWERAEEFNRLVLGFLTEE